MTTTTPVRIRKLAGPDRLRLFPELGESRTECPSSSSGRHVPIDLSGLRYQPTPPFCAWCGRALHDADGREASA